MNAPIVLGQDIIARKIRKTALENNVPLIENPPVARLLHLRIEAVPSVPEEMFRAVAEILACVYSLKGRKK